MEGRGGDEGLIIIIWHEYSVYFNYFVGVGFLMNDLYSSLLGRGYLRKAEEGDTPNLKAAWSLEWPK